MMANICHRPFPRGVNMPIYDFCCENGHLIERREGYETTIIPCPLCGAPAHREAVYFSQSIVTETGVKIGRKTEVPRDERRYDLSLFQEASAELDYAHQQAEEIAQRKLTSENLWTKAKKKANAVLKGEIPPPKDTCRIK